MKAEKAAKKKRAKMLLMDEESLIGVQESSGDVVIEEESVGRTINNGISLNEIAALTKPRSAEKTAVKEPAREQKVAEEIRTAREGPSER